MRVAILLGQDLGFCRRVTSGILKFAGQKGDWEFRDAAPDAALLPALGRWNPDGIIAHLFDPHLAAGLSRLGCPVVSTTDTINTPDWPVVDVDNKEVGREAARYLMRRGYRNFAYFGSGTAVFSKDRKSGFESELAASNFAVHSLQAEFLPKPPAADIWRSTGQRLDQWLESLPRPVAIFCSNDIPARRIAEACRRVQLAIPNEVAILGVDNDSSECRLSSPSLSSIDTPAEQIGHEAAAILSALMKKKNPPKPSVFLPPLHVVTRASTDGWNCAHPVVVSALNYIEENTPRGLRVDAVAKHVAVSRRKLERLFRSEIQRSVLTVIREARFALSKELLATTELRISDVATRSGFPDSRRMHAAYRESTGMTPGEWRKQVR
ncbi:MAG: XylR family transcriptional regulator [Verrucomicrobiota bacterium]